MKRNPKSELKQAADFINLQSPKGFCLSGESNKGCLRKVLHTEIRAPKTQKNWPIIHN